MDQFATWLWRFQNSKFFFSYIKWATWLDNTIFYFGNFQSMIFFGEDLINETHHQQKKLNYWCPWGLIYMNHTINHYYVIEQNHTWYVIIYFDYFLWCSSKMFLYQSYVSSRWDTRYVWMLVNHGTWFSTTRFMILFTP